MGIELTTLGFWGKVPSSRPLIQNVYLVICVYDYINITIYQSFLVEVNSRLLNYEVRKLFLVKTTDQTTVY